MIGKDKTGGKIVKKESKLLTIGQTGENAPGSFGKQRLMF